MSITATREEGREAAESIIHAGQRLVLYNVDWPAYEAIGEALRDRPGLQLTYDRGVLEIVTTSSTHEWYKRMLGRLIEALVEECGGTLRPGGSMTFKRADLKKGFEPDECFWIQSEPAVRGRLVWEPESDPPPDLMLEIEVSRSAADRMGIFAAMGVLEVWRLSRGMIDVYALGPDGAYERRSDSPTFPGFPVGGMARFARPDESKDYLEVIREFRAWVRAELESGRGKAERP